MLLLLKLIDYVFISSETTDLTCSTSTPLMLMFLLIVDWFSTFSSLQKQWNWLVLLLHPGRPLASSQHRHLCCHCRLPGSCLTDISNALQWLRQNILINYLINFIAIVFFYNLYFWSKCKPYLRVLSAYRPFQELWIWTRIYRQCAHKTTFTF